MPKRPTMPVNIGPERIVTYRRVSTLRQEESGLGLDAQVHAIENYRRSRGAVVIGEYTETETGKRDELSNRPELLGAIAHAQRAGARLVIAKLDRLARSVYVTAALHKAGVDFVACDYPDANRLTIQILAAVAENEARMISQRTRDALAAYKAGRKVSKRIRSLYPAGVPAEVVEATAGRLGSALPQCRHNLSAEARAKGTARSVEARRAAAIAAVQDLAPRMVSMWRMDRLSLREIAGRLNAEGQTTRSGGLWTAMAVKRVLDRLSGQE
jgi:DNA invertase Pin-like site-specific DNA recombinase